MTKTMGAAKAAEVDGAVATVNTEEPTADEEGVVVMDEEDPKSTTPDPVPVPMIGEGEQQGASSSSCTDDATAITTTTHLRPPCPEIEAALAAVEADRIRAATAAVEQQARVTSIALGPGAYRVRGPNYSRDPEADSALDFSAALRDGGAPIITDASVTGASFSVPVAYTVPPDEPAVEAEPMEKWYKRKSGKRMICISALLGVALVVAIVAGATNSRYRNSDDAAMAAGGEESQGPTTSPSYDSRLTLERVRDRDVLQCGVTEQWVGSNLGGYVTDLCRAIASAVLGNPSKFQLIRIPVGEHFVQLANRQFDVLLSGDEWTLGRSIREPSSKAGFIFSYPWFYTSTVFAGLSSYVECADKRLRNGDCANLKICYEQDPLVPQSPVQSLFPPFFLRPQPTFQSVLTALSQGHCNVVASDVLQFVASPSMTQEIESGLYTFGTTMMDSGRLSLVTRNDDIQWGAIVTGVVDSVIFHPPVSTECPVPSTNSLNVSFASASSCVGNRWDLEAKYLAGSALKNAPFLQFDKPDHAVGYIGAPRFGLLNCNDCPNALEDEKGTLGQLAQRKVLNCGVIDDGQNQGFTLMNEIYCRSLSVAIFHGDQESVNITYYKTFDDASEHLSNGDLDVVAGDSLYRKSNPLELWEHTGRFEYSIHYYLKPNPENEWDVRPISLVTRADDTLFTSFVDAVVTSTVIAMEQGITQETSETMPLIELFGPELSWMFRDVIFYAGNHAEIYQTAFGEEVSGFDLLISAEDMIRETWGVIDLGYLPHP